MTEQLLYLRSIAYSVAILAPLNERRACERQAVLAAYQTEVALAGLAASA